MSIKPFLPNKVLSIHFQILFLNNFLILHTLVLSAHKHKCAINLQCRTQLTFLNIPDVGETYVNSTLL